MGSSCGCVCEDGGIARCPQACLGPSRPDRALEQDFVHDTLADGRPFCVLTRVGHWSHQSPILEAGFRMSGAIVGDALDRVSTVTEALGPSQSPTPTHDWDRLGVAAGANPSANHGRAPLDCFCGTLSSSSGHIPSTRL